jgi:hypothetical protein
MIFYNVIMKLTKNAIMRQGQALLTARSAHAPAVDAARSEALEATLDVMQKKEAMVEQMLTIHKMKIKAYSCQTCQYHLADFRPTECRAAKHIVTTVSAYKRWFECKQCHQKETYAFHNLTYFLCCMIFHVLSHRIHRLHVLLVVCVDVSRGHRTLQSYPERACTKCGAYSYAKSSIYRGPTAAIPVREQLMVRGQEHGFSLRSDY